MTQEGDHIYGTAPQFTCSHGYHTPDCPECAKFNRDIEAALDLKVQSDRQIAGVRALERIATALETLAARETANADVGKAVIRAMEGMQKQKVPGGGAIDFQAINAELRAKGIIP
jgi:hypothetical protein